MTARGPRGSHQVLRLCLRGSNPNRWTRHMAAYLDRLLLSVVDDGTTTTGAAGYPSDKPPRHAGRFAPRRIGLIDLKCVICREPAVSHEAAVVRDI